MKKNVLNLMCVLSLFCCSFVSTAADQVTSTSPSIGTMERYLVTISEYQLPDAASPELTADEIASQIAARRLVPIETIRVAIVDGIEGMAQFGKQVAIVSSVTGKGDEKTRRTRDVPIGTMVRVNSKSNGSEIVLSIQYESSRLNDNGTDDSPPDLITNRITTTLSVPLSKLTLLGGTSKDQTTFTFLTLTKLTRDSKKAE